MGSASVNLRIMGPRGGCSPPSSSDSDESFSGSSSKFGVALRGVAGECLRRTGEGVLSTGGDNAFVRPV